MSIIDHSPEFMTHDEWGELYSYLLTRLREMQLIEVVNEVEFAASTRIIEESNEALPLFEDLDTTISRAPSPHEAFDAVIKVLETRLHEVPALIAALHGRLKYLPSQIQWLPDAGPNDVFSQLSRFSGETFVLSTSELDQIASALMYLKQLLPSTNNK